MVADGKSPPANRVPMSKATKATLQVSKSTPFFLYLNSQKEPRFMYISKKLLYFILNDVASRW